MRNIMKMLTVLGGGGVVYLLRDLFTTPLAAGSVDATDSEPGPGIREVTADSGSNLSVASDQLQIAAAVGDTDPAIYWTQNDGSGIARASGRALIAYYQNGVWIGWSNSTTLATAALLYGAKGRDAYAAGVAWTEALPSGDPVHIIILTATGAQHVVRVGVDEYLAFTYPLGSDVTLYPAMLGDVAQLDSLYVYDVPILTPVASLSAPAEGATFTHPATSFFLEIEITTLSTSADTIIVLREQDSENRLMLYLTAARQLSLYRLVANVLTLISHLSAAGAITNGSRICLQMQPPSIFQTSSGSAQIKAWVNGTLGATSTTPPFAGETAGRVHQKPAGTTFGAIKTWELEL